MCCWSHGWVGTMATAGRVRAIPNVVGVFGGEGDEVVAGDREEAGNESGRVAMAGVVHRGTEAVPRVVVVVGPGPRAFHWSLLVSVGR